MRTQRLFDRAVKKAVESGYGEQPVSKNYDDILEFIHAWNEWNLNLANVAWNIYIRDRRKKNETNY